MTQTTERRRRLKRPRVLIFFATLILVLPLVNYIGMSLKYSIPAYLPHKVLAAALLQEDLLMITALLSGIGLLMIKRWGWSLFAIASIAFIGHNAYIFYRYPATLQKGPLLHSLLVLLTMVYFFRRDIYLPYWDLRRRGWRLFKRYPLSIPVQVNDLECVTENVSMGGLFISHPDFSIAPNSEVRLKFRLGGIDFSFRGGVAAVTTTGAGISYRGLSKSDRLSLRHAILAQITSSSK